MIHLIAGEGNWMELLLDGLALREQRQRAAEQMTLGKLIQTLESLPAHMEIEGLEGPHSYRGYYDDLALEPVGGTVAAGVLLAECKAVMGKALDGYKGGLYVMGELTPVWVSAYRDASGKRLMGIAADGSLITEMEA